MKPHLVVLSLAVAICLGYACAGGPSRLADAVNAAVADGKVTPEERASIQALIDEEAQGIDWETTLAAAVPSILASFLGVNFYRNNREKKVWGTPAVPAQAA